ncbi:MULTISPECIES: sugar phosphate isomerase/epimerase family protein [unclassified Variovorax]|uniref:sugar phosphate isomerase/epimerase family protein n=1 Tax=unclassified Variovorax TaxID=663243 RepID=UPI00076BED6D|nr:MULTISPECIES: sugar phosphate isomerase/epimerase family protein [unclassified Variovorax]KWT97573.1 putative D-tagatose 3-epimerase [Variovorax sp. WDL1]PNG55981.1 D-tagatose 3-epimerase [Variovorax sp. B4]PNG57405.1 D-tagatose 3-epimerase [Variovorax sp. B2]VTV10226.1 D-tagatose 3-epimerase [Variovorax sp. WDL1]
MQFALCNEVLKELPFPEQCRVAAALGYDGLEVAPFTLCADPMDLSDAQAREFGRMALEHGLEISGLHWLLVAPAGLSIVSADAALRQRSTAVMQRLVELCALMGGRYLVHGSPKQRSVPPGETRAAALERARECLAAAAQTAQQCGVIYCIEPLSTAETDLLNTVEEAVELVQAIGSPAFRTMIDCSAAGQMEREDIPALMRRWMPTGYIAHVQVNDPNRRGPGQGDMRFAPILAALHEMKSAGHYPGIVAVEPFDYVPDGVGSAAWAIGYLRGLEEASGHA